MDGFQLGRLGESELDKPVLHDAPEKQMQAIMSKIDELILAMQALAAANTSVPEVDALKKIELKL